MRFTSIDLATYAHELTFDDLSNENVEKAKTLVLDSLGCCIGAYASPPSKHLRSLYAGREGGDQATVIGSGQTAPIEYAALINSTMVRYLDYNDAYISEGRACHPSDHVPALLSVAEAEGRSGADLIEAIAVAYELEAAGLDTGAIWEQGYDYVTWGSYSSVAAVGKLLALSEDQLVDAMGIAGASNVALGVSRRGDVSVWKGLAHPYVTHNAVQACQMARAGITGPERVFEGPSGFYEAVSGGELGIDELAERDPADRRLMYANLKPYPCGYYMQAAIAGICELTEGHDVDPSEIEAIDVETFAQAVEVLAGPEKWSTDLTRESADHSIPYTAAVAALYGDVTPEHYGETHRRDGRVHRLIDLVSVRENDDLSSYVTDHPSATPMVVTIETGEGSYETRVDYAPGHAQNPLSTEEVERKLTALATGRLTAEQIDAVVRFCDDLENRDAVDALLPHLTI